MAKYCGKCGTQLQDNAAFCPNCGSATQGEIIDISSASEKVVTTTKEKKKNFKKWIIGIAIPIIAIILVVILSFFEIVKIPFLSDLFSKESNSISYKNNDMVYHPEIEDISFDENENIAYFNDVLIVYTFSDISKSEREKIAKTVNGEIVGNISGSINAVQIRVEKSNLQELNEKADLLMKLDNVLFAGYDYPIEISPNNSWNGNSKELANDLGNENNPDGNDWWAEAIGAYTAWENSNTPEKIKVGILDSGFEVEHSDLKDKITFLDDYSDNTKDDHGTHVAGLIAANNNGIGIRGVADNSELVCVDWSPVTNDDESSDFVSYLSTGEYLEIIKQLVENDVRVINNSWGMHIYSKEGYTEDLYGKSNDLMFLLQYFAVHKTGAYEAYLEYIDALSNRTALESMLIIIQLLSNNKNDFLIVQSAGNGYDNGGKGFDASKNGFFCAIDNEIFNILNEDVRNKLSETNINYGTIKDHILIVGATENKRDSNGNYQMTSFSNFGDNLDICAPGGSIYSTVCNNEYKEESGTSMSGPIVAGSAALLWSNDMTLSASDVKKLMIDNCIVKAIGVGDGAGKNYPMLNIGNSIKALNNKNISDIDITGNNYEYAEGEKLSQFYVNEEKSASLMFWNNYGASASTEDFFFDWESNKWEYTLKGNRSNEMYNITFTPTEKGIHIKAVSQDGILVDNEYLLTSQSTNTDSDNTQNTDLTENEIKDLVIQGNGYWESNLDTFAVYKFNSDGTVINYGRDTLKSKELYQTEILNYSISGNYLILKYKSGYEIRLEPVTKKSPVEWNKGLSSQLSSISNDEIFFYETSWVDDGGECASATPFYLAKSDFEFTIATSSSDSNNNLKSLDNVKIIKESHYTGNLGDSRVFNLNGNGLIGNDDIGYRYGNTSLNGTTLENGFEVWIARWNYGDKISWASATFDLNKQYKKLTGKTDIIKSYNTTNYDTTVYFYNGDTLLSSYRITPDNYQMAIEVDVSNVKELTLLVKDNIETAGGTSFALYDMFLS